MNDFETRFQEWKQAKTKFAMIILNSIVFFEQINQKTKFKPRTIMADSKNFHQEILNNVSIDVKLVQSIHTHAEFPFSNQLYTLYTPIIV